MSPIAVPAPFDTPYGMYLKWGVSPAYVVHEPLDAARIWLEDRFASLGYVMTGQGEGALSGPPPTDTFTIAADRSAVWITAAYQARGPDQTALQYWVEALSLPTRPHRTLILGRVRSVTLFILRTGESAARKRRITNPRAAMEIVRAINHLPVYGSYAAISSCPLTSVQLSIQVVTRSGALYVLSGGGCGGWRLRRRGHPTISIGLNGSHALSTALTNAGVHPW